MLADRNELIMYTTYFMASKMFLQLSSYKAKHNDIRNNMPQMTNET